MEKEAEEEEVTVAEAEEEDAVATEVEDAGEVEEAVVDVVEAATMTTSSRASTNIPCPMAHHRLPNDSGMMIQLQLRAIFLAMGLKPPHL